MVNRNSAWLRLWLALGLGGGALYLAVLPVGHSAALRSISFVAAFLAAIALWSAPEKRLWPVLGAIATWGLAAGVSLVSSRDVAASLDAMENEILRALMVCTTFYMLSRRLDSNRIWAVATAVGFGGLSAAAIYAFAVEGEWDVGYVPKLGDYATAAITVLPLLAGYLTYEPREPWLARSIVAAAVVLILAGGYLTLSRSFWLVISVAMLVGILLYARRIRHIAKRQIAVVAAASAAAIGLAAIAAIQKDRTLLYFEDRSPIYSAALEKISSNPITGSGYGYETDKQWYAARLPGVAVFHAHNIVLSYFDQMGPLGLVALIMIFGAPAWVFWRALDAPSEGGRAAAICGLVLLACVFVKNNLDYFFWKHNLWLFFAHLGIFLGRLDRSYLAVRIR